MVTEVIAALGGTAWDYTNTTSVTQEIVYASLTAPAVVRCAITLNGTIVETVFAGAGGSHSWWRGSSSGLLAGPLQPGDRVVVTVNGPSAFRADVQ